MTGRGGERTGKLLEECEDVDKESSAGLEVDEPEDGGGESVNVGGERGWSVPGVMVLFSDFGREVAKGDGAKGEALMAGINEGVRALSGLEVRACGLRGWLRRVEVSALGIERAGGVERAGGGVWFSLGIGVELSWDSGVESFETTGRRDGVEDGCLGGEFCRAGSCIEDRFKYCSFSFMELLSSVDDLLPMFIPLKRKIFPRQGERC